MEIAKFWLTACSENVTSTFAFGGTAWPVPADDMNVGLIADGVCLGAVFDAQQGLT